VTVCSESHHNTALVDYRRHSMECGLTERTSTDVAIDDDVIQQRLGTNIKQRREEAGLTQASLAERAGIHRTFLNQVENGRKGITTAVLVRLAVALDTSPPDLVQGLI
jgi:DNA-binding XRE family transcriptional regulator